MNHLKEILSPKVDRDGGEDGSSRRQMWLITGAFLLVQLFIWSEVFQNFWFISKATVDVHEYYRYAQYIAAGYWPYRDFPVEYPPLSLLVFYLPRLISTHVIIWGAGYNSYFFWFQAETFLLSCGSVVAIAATAWQIWRSRAKLIAALLSYSIFIVAIGSLVEVRYDIAVAFLLMAGIAFFIRGKKSAAWVFLGLGFSLKIVPILVAPLFLIVHFHKGEKKEMWRGPLLMGATIVVLFLPFIVSGASGVMGSFLNLDRRPLEVESTLALPYLWAGNLDHQPVKTDSHFGSLNIVPSYGTAVGIAAAVILLTLLEISYMRFANSFPDKQNWHVNLIRYATIMMVAFIVFGKVFSPQYLIWLIPLMSLMMPAGKKAVAGLFAATLLLTQYEFPYHWRQMAQFARFMLAEITLRNVLLIIILVLLFFYREDLQRVRVRSGTGQGQEQLEKG